MISYISYILYQFYCRLYIYTRFKTLISSTHLPTCSLSPLGGFIVTPTPSVTPTVTSGK